MSVTKAKTDNITSLNAAQLTGVLPAMSGAALTGIDSVTKNASDPTISTNPSGGVGTLWANTTSGEMFACTDATAGENVWINVGGGSGYVHKTTGFAGEIAGYTVGGDAGASSTHFSNVIQRFAFASAGNQTDHGDMVVGVYGPGSASSQTQGFSAGGYNAPTRRTRIEKFTFATASGSTTHGDLNQGLSQWCGCSSSTDGFMSGGYAPSTTSIDRFAFSSNTTGSDHASLSLARQNNSVGQNSSTDGFNAGGNSDPGAGTRRTVIDKFSFASTNTSATHGDLTTARTGGGSLSTATDGYSLSGSTVPSNTFTGTTNAEKFSFASNTTAAASGNSDLIVPRAWCGSHSGRTFGFISGGWGGPGTGGSLTSIEKFTYASSTTAIDHGDIFLAVYGPPGGHQL